MLELGMLYLDTNVRTRDVILMLELGMLYLDTNVRARDVIFGY